MASSARQPALRRRIVIALATAATILLPLALPAAAENLSAGTAAMTAPPADGLLDTLDQGAASTTGMVQQLGNGKPLRPLTNTTSHTAQRTATGATGLLRQPPTPAPAIPDPHPAPAPLPATMMDASAAAMSDTGSINPTAGSAGLRVAAASLLLANDAGVAPLVAEALSAAPSAFVLVAEPLARSFNLPLEPPQASTSDGALEVQAARSLPRGVWLGTLIAAALLVAATAGLVGELGIRRSAPRAT